MNKTIKRQIIYFVCLIAGVAWQVQAHQQKEAISTILFNERTGNIEISHRFYIHDAEHAVKGILNGKADLIKDKDTQSAFAKYVTERFSLAINQDQIVSSQLLGQEVEGKFFWVYQEAPISAKPQKISVRFDALMEVWPSQRNIVNIEGLGPIKSVELLSSQSTKTITF